MNPEDLSKIKFNLKKVRNVQLKQDPACLLLRHSNSMRLVLPLNTGGRC